MRYGLDVGRYSLTSEFGAVRLMSSIFRPISLLGLSLPDLFMYELRNWDAAGHSVTKWVGLSHSACTSWTGLDEMGECPVFSRQSNLWDN